MFKQRFVNFAIKDLLFLILGVTILVYLLVDRFQGQKTLAVENLAAPRHALAAPSMVNDSSRQETGLSPTSVWVNCTPVGIASYKERIHVRCAESYTGIYYFAVSTSDAPYAARVLSVITAAQVAGRILSVLYDPADTSGSTFGCATDSCRVMYAVGFGQ